MAWQPLRRVGMIAAWMACLTGLSAAQTPSLPAKTQQETMAERGYVRYRGGWRTAQEIELMERADRAHLARAEWKSRLERLRRRLDEPTQAERAAEEIAEIADSAAVAALGAAVATDRALQARVLFLQALARIRSGDATAALMAVAVDHVDPETRTAAVEHLATVAPETAVAGFTAALASPDNPRINRAAEALGRLLAALPAESPLRHDDAVLGRLVAALETQHMGVAGDGIAEGATSVTFTPSGGGLALGGGPKPVRITVKNERVLDTLAASAGVNFEWNLAAWRAWLATREAPADLDLRRR